MRSQGVLGVSYEYVMSTRSPALFLLVPSSRDVVLLRWPEQRDEVERLDQLGVARLLLLEPDAAPPDIESCLQDWIRLPATDADVRARLLALEHRATTHASIPTVSEFGELSHRGKSLFLSPLDQRIVEVLVDRFGDVVGDRDLRERVWPAGATQQALRVHISRLRHRIFPLGLTITSVRSSGYAMRTAVVENDPLPEGRL
jgi:hypothetical protein